MVDEKNTKVSHISKAICSFTGKELEKYNRFYNQDGTYMDVNVKQFLDAIPELPVESLEYLIKEANKARGAKLTTWVRILKFLRIK
jgi:hypothetical protein